MRTDIPVVTILGIPVAVLTKDDALGEIAAMLDTERTTCVAFVNAHSLNVACGDDSYRRALHAADLVFNDGAGLALAGRTLGRPFPANLNGTDLTPEILRVAAARGHPVYLLGGDPGVAKEASRRIQLLIPGLRIVGTHHGYFDMATESTEVARAIRDSGAELLLVGMGNPRQEQWIAEHVAATGVRMAIGVGAYLDFAAGRVARAPRTLRTLRLEWLYRLAIEPRRLGRRYIVGNPIFIARIINIRLQSISSETAERSSDVTEGVLRDHVRSRS